MRVRAATARMHSHTHVILAESVSQGENLAKIQKSQRSARDIENVTRRSAKALTAAQKGVSQEPSLGETKKKKGKRLGAHSGAARREQGAKSRPTLKI